MTGAAGGVGSIAVAVLSKLEFRVAAMTGRPAEAEFLRQLGAAEILERAQFAAPGKPLAKERWAGAIDVVGSHTLANVCASLALRRRCGSVRSCRRDGFSRHRSSLHTARHHACGYRQRDAAAKLTGWKPGDD